MKRTSTLCVASKAPGPCNRCRHSNQDTVDFSERKVFCSFGGLKRPEGPCDAAVELPRDIGATPARYFLFEPYDGKNGTWGALQNSRVVAEDATERQRAAMRADQPVLEVEVTAPGKKAGG